MLVSYGSDSNSDDGLAQPTAPLKATPPVPEASSSKPKGLGGLDLPPPKAKASKKEKGPVKIQLTDVSSSNVDAAYQHNDEPAKKRPKLGLGSGGGKSGLVGMLPAPKKDTVKPSASGSSGPSAAPAALSTTQDAADPLPQEDPVTLMMMPKAVKRKQPPAPTEEPAQDMFGLSSLGSSTSAATISSTSATPSSIRKTLSAAPTIAEKPRQNFYATLGPATPDNPYPGFHCIPETGQWEPDRPDEWSEWAALHGYAQSAQASSSSQAQGAAGQAPRGFEGASQANMAEVSSEQQRADAEASRASAAEAPSKAAYVDPKEAEEKRLKLAKLQGAGRARGKNQLSSLLSNAISQREDLEERIALAKSNKRAGGAKYGF